MTLIKEDILVGEWRGGRGSRRSRGRKALVELGNVVPVNELGLACKEICRVWRLEVDRKDDGKS
jgi:hypothetical protein